MKKFLSLVLALVMTMSLVTISAGAKDFTDGDKVTYNEAIDVMSALKVIDGYTDGSFKPQTQLNRGQAAKILCNMILGPTTASALSADAAPFKDVPADSTFAGYIAYCSKAGIIDGYTDGTFRPSAPLTGYAFMKLLLGALGYDKDVEGYNQPNWSINVAKQAIGIGLDKGLTNEFDGTKIVTREEACLYAFNTLKATMVEYDAKTSVNVGDATVVIAGSKAKEIEDKNNTAAAIKWDGKLQFAEKYFPKLTCRIGDGTDAFGRPATEWKYKSEVIGTYTDYSNLKATYTKKATKGGLYELIGSSIVSGLKKNDYTLDVWVNGTQVKDRADANTDAIVSTYFSKNNSAAAGPSGNGVRTEVFMDDENNVTITYINTYLVKATADYNSKKEALTIETIEVNEAEGLTPVLPTSISNDDINVESFKEGDYILVTYSNKTEGIESVQLAEVVTGKVSEFTVTDYVIVDGTKYSYNKLVGTAESGVEYTINEDAKLVLDEYGYVLFVDEAVSTSSYVFIQKVAGATALKQKAVAAAYFTDGTTAEIDLKKVDGKTSGTYMSNNTNVHGWYTYLKNSDGAYTLTSAKAPQTASGALVNKAGNGTTSEDIIANNVVKFTSKATNSKSAGEIGSVTPKANASTVFVLVDPDGDVTTYTGIANAPTVTLSKDATYTSGSVYAEVNYLSKNGYATYVFVDLSRMPKTEVSIDDANSIADYLMILKATNNKTVVGEDTYYQYKVLFDGEETTKYINDDIISDLADVQGALVYSVKANSKGYITTAKPFASGKPTQEALALTGATNDDATKGYIKQSGKTLSICYDNSGSAAEKNYIITNDTAINLVVGKDVTSLLKDANASYELYMGISANQLANSVLKNSAIDATVYATVDEAGSETLEVLYVYVDGAVTADDPAAVSLTSVKVNGKGTKMLDDGLAATISAVTSPVKVYAGAKFVDVIEAVGVGTASYKLQRGWTSGNFTGYAVNDSTAFSSTAGKTDVVEVTMTAANGDKVVKYIVVETEAAPASYAISNVKVVKTSSGKLEVTFDTATALTTSEKYDVTIKVEGRTSVVASVDNKTASAGAAQKWTTTVAPPVDGDYYAIVTVKDSTGDTLATATGDTWLIGA